MQDCSQSINILSSNIYRRAVHIGWLFSSLIQKYHISYITLNRCEIYGQGDEKMIEKESRIGKMIIQMIVDGQLSINDENEIKQVIEERDRKREEERRGRCLAGIVEERLIGRAEAMEITESTKRRYMTIIRRCFKETVVGKLDGADLTEEIILEFIIEAHESMGLDRNGITFFMGMLQAGLNKLADDGVLNFVPDKKIFKNYIESEQGTHYIDNPYTAAEVKAIVDRIKRNPQDIRGLSVWLWLTGDISPEEIVRMKKQDLRDSDGNVTDKPTVIKKSDAERYLPLTGERREIISHVQEACADSNLEYVFVIKKEGKSKRLTNKSLQIKLYYICQEIGIKYRAFHYNDTIICDR